MSDYGAYDSFCVCVVIPGLLISILIALDKLIRLYQGKEKQQAEL